MALLAKAGSIVSRTTTGSQAYTGLGFQPKVVIFYGNLLPSSSSSSIADYRMMLGCATSSTQRWVVSMVDDDNVATSTSSRSLRTNRCIEWISVAEAVQGSADFTSFDADGFTLNWSVVEGSARTIGYLALGGSDLTNVRAGSFDLTTTAGNQAVTGVGFLPECVLLAASIANITEGPVTLGHLAFGLMTGSAQWAVGNLIADASAVNNTIRAQRDVRCLFGLTTTPSFAPELSRWSLDSDGFTVQKLTVGASTRRVPYLCLKGGQVKLGKFDGAGTDGPQAVTGVGFRPTALLLSSVVNPTSSSIESHASLNIGAASGVGSEFAAMASSVNAADPTISRRSALDALYFDTFAGTTGTLDSFDSDGFTVEWATTTGTALEMAYWAFGETVTHPPAYADDSVAYLQRRAWPTPAFSMAPPPTPSVQAAPVPAQYTWIEGQPLIYMPIPGGEE